MRAFLAGLDQLENGLFVGFGDFAAFAAEALGHGRPEFLTRGIDQHDLAPVGSWLAVAQEPDVGADAGVVENLLQAGRRWLPASRSPNIQRRISDSPESAPPVKSGEPLRIMPMWLWDSSGSFMRAMRCCKKSIWPSDLRGVPAPKRPSKPWRPPAMTASVVLAPLVAIGRIHELEVEAHVRELVVGEGAAELDVSASLPSGSRMSMSARAMAQVNGFSSWP